VWVAGRALGGTGETGLGTIAALHFARAETPERPELEVLAQGGIDDYYDVELRDLKRRARPIEWPPTSGD
jgi:hypothetical protein